MPINPIPTSGQRTWKISVAGPDNVEFTVEAYTATSTEGQADAATQSLINHLAQWPDLVEIGYAQKQAVEVYAITPDVPPVPIVDAAPGKSGKSR
jgi:hypothetical protein